MPIRCFWTLSENINRIKAQDDMRALSIAIYSQSSEGYHTYRERLELELGEVFTYQYTKEAINSAHQLDRSGLEKLRASTRRT